MNKEITASDFINAYGNLRAEFTVFAGLELVFYARKEINGMTYRFAFHLPVSDKMRDFGFSVLGTVRVDMITEFVRAVDIHNKSKDEHHHDVKWNNDL